MPENDNVRLAQELSEQDLPDQERTRWEELIEIAEVLLLAFVAIATAWSGYQAAKWDGKQSMSYGAATAYRFQADAASTYGGQELSADAAMFTAWLQATSAHDGTLANLYVRRFTPDFRTAFAAWLKTDPLTNPAAPPGPGYMPQYHNPGLIAAAQLNRRAAAADDQGTAAGEHAEEYVRDTVLFAAVLFLVGLAQRFKIRHVRIATTTLAFALLIFTAVSVIQLPRT